MQQQRHIANRLDIERRQPHHQPVARQSGHADQYADDRGQHNAQQGHPQRVQDADEVGAPVAAGGVVGDDALADAEASLAAQETEAGADRPLFQIGQGVGDEVPPMAMTSSSAAAWYSTSRNRWSRQIAAGARVAAVAIAYYPGASEEPF